VVALLQKPRVNGNLIAKFHEILLLDAFIDHLLSVCKHEMSKQSSPMLEKEYAFVSEVRKVFDLPDDQYPASQDWFEFPCTWDLVTLGRLYIFEDYICFADLGKFNVFKICFDDVTSVNLASLVLDYGIEISFEPSGQTVNLSDKSSPVKSPVKLKTFSWDLTDRRSRESWQKLTFVERLNLSYLRDLAHSIMLNRLVSLGKMKPNTSLVPSYSVSDIDKYRLMFEHSHKMTVSVIEYDSGGFFSSLAAKFKPKTSQLLVMEQCARCESLLDAPALFPPSSSAYPPVRVVLYDLRKTDVEPWMIQDRRVYKFDYKATRHEVDEKLEDSIDFETRRVIGGANELVLDIQLSSDAPGGFEIVFKLKSSNKIRAKVCAEPFDFRNEEEDPAEQQTRALHVFELVSTACLAGNPDVLSPEAHRLLSLKVLGNTRPQNLADSANHGIRVVLNSPWQLQNLWQPPVFKLSVFFSSTFTDTKRERAVIMESILPKLSQRGKQTGVQCVFTDMRWGVLDQNTVHQDTWDVCDREIRRSERESCDIFFVSLQSEKYGYMPLPKYLPSSAAAAVSAIEDEHVRKLFSAWYKQDLNDPDARFNLLPLSNIDDKPFWQLALPVLRQALSGIVFDEPAGLVVGRAVTEWEFFRASEIGARDRMFWFKREFDFEEAEGKYWKDVWQSKGAKQNYNFFCDASERSRLDSLWRRMHLALGPNVKEYRPRYSKEYINENGQEIHSPPLSTDFSKDAEQLLSDAMERVIAQKQRWFARAGGLIPNFQDPLFAQSNCTRNAELITEMLFHSEMARRICSTFWRGPAVHAEARSLERIAQDIVDIINKPFDTRLTAKNDVMSPVIALVGSPCSGKSAVMARV
jgi:hypothetical protein